MVGYDSEVRKHEDLNRIVRLVDEGEGGISSIKNITAGIIAIINDPESSARDLKKLIELDPPLTAKILRVANSAYYAPKKKVSDIGQAIVNIGFNNVKELALSQKVCEIFNQKKRIGGYSRVFLWNHSISIAMLGKMIYRKEFGEKGDNIYIAGLLHDIGVIVEDQFLHDDFKLILKRAMFEEENLPQAELSVLGYTHADIGRAITTDWNFPEVLRDAIGFHHIPDKVKAPYSRMTATLFIAEHLSAECGIGYPDAPFTEVAVFQEQLTKLGLHVQGLGLIVKEMAQELSKMERLGLFEI